MAPTPSGTCIFPDGRQIHGGIRHGLAELYGPDRGVPQPSHRRMILAGDSSPWGISLRRRRRTSAFWTSSPCKSI